MNSTSPRATPINGRHKNRQYDIVIPVYNGLHFFRECYQSVKHHTSPHHTIVIVNDGSTEEALTQYLDQIAADSTTVVLHLPVNRGFVHAVNQGMSHSKNDVILLNSDTVVTQRWVEKLDAALYSSPNVGTVTPWTNKGTICSLPRFCEDNELPPMLNADDISKMAETVSKGRYLHLPTAVGFCTAIRRQVLEDVGIFDEKTYGRGYGEENDFSMRAKEAGYVNIIDDRTFILHKGSMTFTGEKEKVLESHLKKLHARHPRYMPQVLDFIDRDPLSPLRSRINRLIEHQTGKTHVLFLLHNDPLGGWAHNPGGTEYHVLDLAEALYHEGTIIPFILASSGSELLLLEKDAAGDWQRSRVGLENPIDLTTTYDGFYRDRLLEVLDLHHIDILHIHQLVHSPCDINAMLGGWQGALFFTLHDFYTICPSYNLITPDNTFCHYNQLKKCPSCTLTQKGARINLPDHWHQVHSNNLQRADMIYIPSKSCRDWIAKVYPEISSSLVVREHGIHKSGLQTKRRRAPGQRLRIGFIGGLTKVKGSELICEIVNLDTAKEIDWLILGEIGDADLMHLERSNVKKTGRYDKDTLPSLLTGSNLDLMVICSIWPETFSYTLSECWDVGLPVIVGPLGAPADRVKQHGGGWVTQELHARSFWQTIQGIMSATDECARGANEAEKIPMMTVEEMAGLYREDYCTLAAKKALPLYRPDCSRPLWPGMHKDAMINEKGGSLEQLIAERNRIAAERDHLLNTKSWRITAPLRLLEMSLKKLRKQSA